MNKPACTKQEKATFELAIGVQVAEYGPILPTSIKQALTRRAKILKLDPKDYEPLAN